MEQLTHSAYWPFVVLLLSIIMVVILITRLRFHPFVALIISAIFVGLISPTLPIVTGQNPLITAVELPMTEFGIMAGKIAWVIALAAVIGTAMMESGAAEQIVNWLLKSLGEKQAAIALIISGFILSIPVFFDTVFFLLIPLGITLALKTGKDYVLYVVAIGGGAAITHSLVPPTPGPLIMAETLSIELGTAILGGLAAGIVPALAVLMVAKWLNKRLKIPVRVAKQHVTSVKNAPSLGLSVLPVIVPLLMISFASVIKVITGDLPAWVAFQGNKNIAMSAGAIIALILWTKTQKLGLKDLWNAVAKPLEVAGIIILITSAGGAYGAMIKHSGIGDAIGLATEGFNVHYIVLAWLIAAVMKIAQGSGTVAMITAAAIMAALIGTEAQLPYHPIYILLSIGFGSLFISWMNDSGFWVVTRMSGFTEKEGLQVWTFLLAIIALVGLFQLLLFSWIFPLV
ncbi:MAG: gluconate transporter [Saprospiraceae bacterium]|nr:gluconate transporter [Saprospiraceae bacterium]